MIKNNLKLSIRKLEKELNAKIFTGTQELNKSPYCILNFVEIKENE